MYYRDLVISDKNGERTVAYGFADEGKVLVDKDGNDVLSVEQSRISEYTEEDASLYESIPPEEAVDILMGVSE